MSAERAALPPMSSAQLRLVDAASTKAERRAQLENIALNNLETQCRIQRRAFLHHRDRATWVDAVAAELVRAAAQLEQIERDWA